MKRKLLILLPVAGLFLAGCSISGDLPGGYTPVDPKKPEELNIYCDDLGKSVCETINGIKSGFTIEEKVVIDNFHLVNTSVEGGKVVGETTVDIENFKATTNISVAKLSKDFNELQASVELKDVSGSFKANIEGLSFDLEFENVEFAAYLKASKLYLTLSNENFKNLVVSAVDSLLKDAPVQEKMSIKALIPSLCSNYKVDLTGFELVEEFKQFIDLSFDEKFAESLSLVLKSELPEIVEEGLKNGLNVILASYGEGKVGLGFNGTMSVDNTEGHETEKVAVELQASAVFNDKKQLSKITAVVTVDSNAATNIEGDSYTTIAKGSVTSETNISYGVTEIKMPDVTNYTDLPIEVIELLFGLLG